MKENHFSLASFPAGSSAGFPAFVLLKLIGTVVLWKLISKLLGIWGFESFCNSLQFSLYQNLVGTGNPLNEIYWHVGFTADTKECISCALQPWKAGWILPKCNSPRFTERHDQWSVLDLTSLSGWKGGGVTENFLCTTNFNKFVDCGSHTEPNVAFVTWPECLLTVNRRVPSQAIVKMARPKIKGGTIFLLVLAVLPCPFPKYLLQTLNFLPCAWNAKLIFLKENP